MDQEKISDQEIDQILKENKNIPTHDEVINETKNKISDKPINNEHANVDLGELGQFEKVSEKEIEITFNQLEGLIFKVNNCIFRICYLHRGKNRFTAELLNKIEIKDQNLLALNETNKQEFSEETK